MAANSLDVIMTLGDSLTQGGWEPGGFTQRLAYVYARKLDIVNRGLSGYNAEWALPVLKECLAKADAQAQLPKVKILTIWFGANDACILPSPQHVPLPRFTALLSEMIGMVKHPTSPWYSPTTRVILITAPPVDTVAWGRRCAQYDPPAPPNRSHKVTKSYADTVKLVGKGNDVPVVDLWTAVWDAAGQSEEGLHEYLPDGLHLNAAGYEILYDLLIETISKHYPELHYEKLPMAYPAWSEIDFQNPEPSLKSRRIDV